MKPLKQFWPGLLGGGLALLLGGYVEFVAKEPIDLRWYQVVLLVAGLGGSIWGLAQAGKTTLANLCVLVLVLSVVAVFRFP